ncbi:MAG: exosortase family protein XrtM [Pseudomonadota bacterium]
MENLSPQVRFVVLFILLYAVMHFSYLAVPIEYLINFVYRWCINEPAAWVINTLTAPDTVRVEGHRLISKTAILEIVRGCDGSGVFFIMASAILAFSASFKFKAWGVLSGLVLIYLLNQTRVVVLYFVVSIKPDWFTPLHTYYIPTLLIIIMCCFFIWWLNWVKDHDVRFQTAA